MLQKRRGAKDRAEVDEFKVDNKAEQAKTKKRVLRVSSRRENSRQTKAQEDFLTSERFSPGSEFRF